MNWPIYGMWWLPLIFMGVMLVLMAGCALMMLRTRLGLGGMGFMHGPPGDRAQAVLRERYAKGELTKPEYERMREDLR